MDAIEERSDDGLRRTQAYLENYHVIEDSGVPFLMSQNGFAMIFEQTDKPKVVFYPHTGLWRVHGRMRVFKGGAATFLEWYDRQRRIPR